MRVLRAKRFGVTFLLAILLGGTLSQAQTAPEAGSGPSPPAQTSSASSGDATAAPQVTQASPAGTAASSQTTGEVSPPPDTTSSSPGNEPNSSEGKEPSGATSDLQTRIDDAALAANNAWMLICSALVLFMTVPGLAMFYSGLVRRKNVLSVMMQCLILMGVMTILWAVIGYSLAFGGDGPYIGNLDYALMENVQRRWDEPFVDANGNGQYDAGEKFRDLNQNDTYDTGPVTPIEGKIPRLTHMLFQGMFFIITPALICGAFAERMKFSTMLVFLILWGLLVYCPLCHWVWDGGILAFVTSADMEKGSGNGWAGGALDFAGGTVVHISSGISALICALLIGNRLGYGSEDMRPHNLTYTTLGAGMLWVGWFGFNAGSELESDGLAASAFAVTHFSAAAGAVAWACVEWIYRKKPSVLGAASGAVAGLVCITPAAGFVQPMPALFMGAMAGCVCFWACAKLKTHYGYDDSLDAFGVHGVGGTLGAILTGVFATRACWDIDGTHQLGLVEGQSRILMGQIVAVIVTWVFAGVLTFILLKVLDATLGLRVSQESEVRGLDVSEHGEEGYIDS